MNLSLRLATDADAALVLSLQNDAFRSDYERYGECPAYNEPPEAIMKHIVQDLSYIAEVDGTPVGAAHVKRRSATHYYLRVLCVHPTHQGQGYGGATLERLFELHPEATIWSLITPKDNPRNRHVYERAGFTTREEILHSDRLTLVVYQKGDSE